MIPKEMSEIVKQAPVGLIVLGIWIAFAAGIGILIWGISWLTEKLGLNGKQQSSLGREILAEGPGFVYTMPWRVITGRGWRMVKQKIPLGTEARCPVCRRPMVKDDP